MGNRHEANSKFLIFFIAGSALLSAACQPQFNVTKDPNAVAARAPDSTTERTRAQTFDANATGGGSLGSSSSFRLSGANLGTPVKTVSSSSSYVLKGGFQGQLPP